MPDGGAGSDAAKDNDEATVQISLYHYNDDNRIMVYLDKEGKRNPSARRNRAQSAGVAGYQPPGTSGITQEHKVKAKQLATNNALLNRKLKDKLFLDACFLSGVEPRALRNKPFDHFRTEPKRARVLSEEEQRLRYDDFQQHRLELLQVVVAEEEKAYVARAKAQESETSAIQKLQSNFSESLHLEQKQVDRMVRSRKKYEKVLEVENRRLHYQRKKASQRHESMAYKIKKIEEAKQRRKQLLKTEAAEREARIKKAVHDQEKLAAALTKKHDARIKAKNERTAQFLEVKAASQQGNKREEELKARYREQRRLKAEEREAEQRELLTRRLKAKEEHALHVKLAKHEQRVAEKTQKRLKIGARARKAQRLRTAAENRHKQAIEKMERFYEKQQQMEEIKHAINERRKQVLREEKIRRDKWRAQINLERAITPGPGEYNLPSTLKSSGGTFNMSKPKSEMDWVRYRAKQLPAPGDYFNNQSFSSLNRSGGSWSKYKPKSDVEIAMDRARKQPGPGEYTIVLKPDTTSATFGDAEPMSELDRVILNASRSPAPGVNQPDNVPKRPKKLKQLQQQFGVSSKALMFASKMKHKLRAQRAQSAPPRDNDSFA